MSNVTDLNAEFNSRNPNEYRCTGEAKCLHCKHVWVFVATWPVPALECPACSLMMGRPTHKYGAVEGDMIPICTECGNEHFALFGRDGDLYLVCEYCGNDQSQILDDFYAGDCDLESMVDRDLGDFFIGPPDNDN